MGGGGSESPEFRTCLGPPGGPNFCALLRAPLDEGPRMGPPGGPWFHTTFGSPGWAVSRMFSSRPGPFGQAHPVPSLLVPSLLVPSLVVPSLVVPSLVVPSLLAPSLVVPSLLVPSLVVPSLLVPGGNPKRNTLYRGPLSRWES